MISPSVTSVIERISPLMDRNVASALAGNWDALPKSNGSLGRLEDLVIHYGIVKGSASPTLQRKGLILFASDHGIVHEGVTENAQDDTRRQARQFLRGGTAANVVCRQAQIEALVVDVGIQGGLENGALDAKVASGSANFSKGPAMTVAETNAALEAGIRLAQEAALRFDVVGLGQIGVGAACSAAAMLSAMSGREAADTTPRDPGLEDAAMHRRLQAVRSGVNVNQREAISPFGTLRTLGGLDIAAMTGFLLAASMLRLPVILDSFTSAAAALAARAFEPDSLDALMFSHLEPTGAHALMLRFLAVEPILDLRLTEASGFGAALAIQLLDTSLRLYSEIREFA